MAIVKAEVSTKNTPLVSVLLITYNHEKYISQALDSILAQNGGLIKEIIIGEDYSTDSTREIIKTYAEKFNFIKPIFRTANIGLNRNYVEGLRACTGNYIAVMSGDDYWTDISKIQNQVEFLLQNNDYSIIGYNALEKWEDSGDEKLAMGAGEAYDMTFFDFFKFNSIVASQALYKNLRNWKFPEIYFLGDGEDRQLWMMITRHGKARIQVDKIGGVYRRHQGSITLNSKSTRLNDLKNRLINNYLWANYFRCTMAPEFLEAQELYNVKLLKEIIRARRVKEFLLFILNSPSNIKFFFKL